MSSAPPDRPPAHLWGIDAPLTQLSGGHRNRAFRTRGLAQEQVFKTTRRSEASLAWLGAVQDHAEAAGFIVPRLTASRNGCLSEQGWTCEPFMAGIACAAERLGDVEPLLRRFHGLAVGLPQRPGFINAAAFTPGGRGADIDLPMLPPALAAECLDAWRTFDDVPIQAIHGDMNPSNLIWTADGVPALLDWDEARVDVALFDLAPLSRPKVVSDAHRRAILAWEIACSWSIEPDHARRLASAGGFPAQ